MLFGSSKEDKSANGTFLGWNMVLWGSAIDSSKAKKFWPPVVDDVLPPSDVPPRPVINDPDLTVTTVYSKLTDQLTTAPPSLLRVTTVPAMVGIHIWRLSFLLRNGFLLA